MKRAALVAFIVVFAVGMFHYFYAEDHCPVHCPNRGGQLGHVHQHPAGASTCLCFWSSLFSPETGGFAGATDFMLVLSPENEAIACGPLGSDITHPPKSLPA